MSVRSSPSTCILLIVFGTCLLGNAVRPSTMSGNEDANLDDGRAHLDHNDIAGHGKDANLSNDDEASHGQDFDDNAAAARSGAWCREFGASHSGWHWWTDCICKKGFALITRPEKEGKKSGEPRKCPKEKWRQFSYNHDPKLCMCAKMGTVCHNMQTLPGQGSISEYREQELVFDAAPSGLVISTSNGKVMKAPSRESQGARKGVGADWQILEIGGKPFDEDLVRDGKDEECRRKSRRTEGNDIKEIIIPIPCKLLTFKETAPVKFRVPPAQYCFALENIAKAKTIPKEGRQTFKYQLVSTQHEEKCSRPCADLGVKLVDYDGVTHDRTLCNNQWNDDCGYQIEDDDW